MRSSCGIDKKRCPIRPYCGIKKEYCSIKSSRRAERDKKKEGALLDEVWL